MPSHWPQSFLTSVPQPQAGVIFVVLFVLFSHALNKIHRSIALPTLLPDRHCEDGPEELPSCILQCEPIKKKKGGGEWEAEAEEKPSFS